jgi:uridine kinase
MTQAGVAVRQIAYDDLARSILSSTPRLGVVRLVTIDGPSGAGKTSLARRLCRSLRRVPVVHLDHLYEGWTGLDGVGDRLDAWVMTPLRQGLPGQHLVYDWHRGAYAEWREVPLAPVLLVEGVGAGQRRFQDAAVLRIWIDAPEDLRRDRTLEREGPDMQTALTEWWPREARHFEAEHTRTRADLVVDGAPHAGVDRDTTLVVVEDRRRR